jgi:UDP-N-acetylmuramoyl-tripeptide--D-alanyl-D-alanine ligase
VVVGEGAAAIAEGATEGGLDVDRVTMVTDPDEALALLLSELRDGDTILVKASRGAALDLLVDQLVGAAGVGEARA